MKRLDEIRAALYRSDTSENVDCEDIRYLIARVEKFETALKFYADRENWDDNKFCPTIWNDGNPDVGKAAREALAEEDEP